MTERKPPDITFRSWIDQQISEAAERGAFDNLPGTGRPLPKRANSDDAWLVEWMRREGISTEELLPTPLKLRKQSARLTANVQDLGSEQEVRDAVAELNYQIVEWRKLPLGPPIFVPLVDAEAMVGTWREAHPPLAAPAARVEDAAPARRWWRRARC
jgi:hypothetical protein